jgi:ATP-dependent 26S proteasome regulatory subunit
VAGQERLKPQEDKTEEDRSKVDDLRGSPMSVGNLEDKIDENHAIVPHRWGLSTMSTSYRSWTRTNWSEAVLFSCTTRYYPPFIWFT